MNILESYRPKFIEFQVAKNDEQVKDVLGSFPTSEDAVMFIAKNFVSINQKTTVSRFLDNFEKSEIRKEYNAILEDKLPTVEKELQRAEAAFEAAKKQLASAKEYLNATINEAKSLAFVVKRGTTEIEIDDMFTWKLAVRGMFYFYTYIDGEIRLARVSEISQTEKMDLFSSMDKNESYFQSLNENE
jgi:hypothetical protein